MSDSLPSPCLDPAEQFANVIMDWLARFEPLIDAVVALHELGEEDAAREVLQVSAIGELREAWDAWSEWTPRPGNDEDLPLLPLLGEELLLKLWFALWGARVVRLPDGTYLYQV